MWEMFPFLHYTCWIFENIIKIRLTATLSELWNQLVFFIPDNPNGGIILMYFLFKNAIKIISENKTNCSSSSDEVSFFYFKSLSNNYLYLTFIRATTKRLTLSFGKHSVSLYFASSNWLVFDGHISNFNYSLPQLHCIFYTHLLRS